MTKVFPKDGWKLHLSDSLTLGLFYAHCTHMGISYFLIWLQKEGKIRIPLRHTQKYKTSHNDIKNVENIAKSARRATKLHPFSTSADQSARGSVGVVPSEVRHTLAGTALFEKFKKTLIFIFEGNSVSSPSLKYKLHFFQILPKILPYCEDDYIICIGIT